MIRPLQGSIGDLFTTPVTGSNHFNIILIREYSRLSLLFKPYHTLLQYNFMEKTQAQKDRELLKAEKQGYGVETYKKVEHTNSAHLDNKKVAQMLGGDEDQVKVPVMSHDLRIAIQQARQDKGWTQEQLAHAVNEAKGNIRDYENGKMVPSGNVIVKMEKALGCKLPRPVKKKIGE